MIPKTSAFDKILLQNFSCIWQGFFLWLGLVLLLLFSACHPNIKTLPEPLKIYAPQYATGFKIYYYKTGKVLEVNDQYRYFLTSQTVSDSLPKDRSVFSEMPLITTPVARMACMAHSHWAAADLFGKTDAIVGVCDQKFLNDSNIASRIENKTLQNIATNQTIYLETLLSLQPQMIMVSFFDSPMYQKIENQNISVVRNGDFLENHPLGRAEWMIFTAAFFDEEENAIAQFDTICQKYNKLKTKVLNTNSRPTVFDGTEYNGIWYISGGKSYMAQFYKDAGADYLWKDNDNTASLPLDLETVYQKGMNADFWRLYLNNGETYSILAVQNRHYVDFQAWKQRKIIYCNNLKCDLFGAGVFQPDVILNDMVQAFHPEIMVDTPAKYYKLLTN
ncbi:MAG: ABC transporter substrate-binding protein [Bacteroidales bacterium]|nr:ABC transporter substrate-binding protein [Bacteroidales bacterium]